MAEGCLAHIWLPLVRQYVGQLEEVAGCMGHKMETVCHVDSVHGLEADVWGQYAQVCVAATFAPSVHGSLHMVYIVEFYGSEGVGHCSAAVVVEVHSYRWILFQRYVGKGLL